MLDACADFLIENVKLEHQKVYLNDRIRLCVLHKSCISKCYLAKGFNFTQKEIYITPDTSILVIKG